MTLEKEVKLGVWPGFTLPDLSDLADDVTIERSSDQRLEATYHDTADLRLARWGITLRHRTGDEDGWTLKLPKSSSESMLVRDEIVVDGTPKVVPDQILQHIAAWVRSTPLQPVARMQTLRRRTMVVDGEGKPLAEVVDDEVSVFDGRHVALRFREVEAELVGDADEALLHEIVARMRAAGAGQPDPTPKVMRALGPRAMGPPELVVLELEKGASARDVLQAGVTRAVLRVLTNDAGVRLTDDVEAVHQARVGTRRLRSDLRTFAPLLDEHWVSSLRTELGWFADLLGVVRDADVLIGRLAEEIASLDRADAAHGSELLTRVRRQRKEGRTALLAAMRSKRYTALLDALVDAARDPRVLPEAAGPAKEVLPQLARTQWTALAKAVKRAGREPDDLALHGIRIRAKRARYAADVAALVVGKPAIRFSEAVAGVQEVLGEHQDACVRRAWLRDVAPSLTPDGALVAGQLIAMSTNEADRRREEWPDAWKQANEGRLRSWLTP